MSKTFNESQMADPWKWCMGVIENYHLSSKEVSEAVGAPHSTVRSLMNGTNQNPRYPLLCSMLRLCIDVVNGQGKKSAKAAAAAGRKATASAKAEAKKVASEQPLTIDDLL